MGTGIRKKTVNSTKFKNGLGCWNVPSIKIRMFQILKNDIIGVISMCMFYVMLLCDKYYFKIGV